MPSLKKKLSKLGPPPSQRRARSLAAPSGASIFPLPAAVALDFARIRAIWEDWHGSGLIPRPWDVEVYLTLMPGLIEGGLIDWRGLEDVRPKVLGVLERLRTGTMTPEEFEAQMDRSFAALTRSPVPGPSESTSPIPDQQER